MAFTEPPSVRYEIINGKKVPVVECETEVVLRYKKTGKAGIFVASLELVKEGNLKIKQEDLFDDIYIKENK